MSGGVRGHFDVFLFSCILLFGLFMFDISFLGMVWMDNTIMSYESALQTETQVIKIIITLNFHSSRIPEEVILNNTN